MRYMGDIPDPYTKFAVQGLYTYELSGHVNIRGQLFLGSFGASDDPKFVNPAMDRPHPFNTSIEEASILGEYNLLNMEEGKKWTPYGFIGLGFSHFVPYFTQYNPATNRYNNYRYAVSATKKLNVPFGIGIKYGLTENIRIFMEGNFRYTTTDEIDGYQPTDFPSYKKAKANDYFYSGTIGISFRLGGNYQRDKNSGSGKKNSQRNRKNCPPVYL